MPRCLFDSCLSGSQRIRVEAQAVLNFPGPETVKLRRQFGRGEALPAVVKAQRLRAGRGAGVKVDHSWLAPQVGTDSVGHVVESQGTDSPYAADLPLDQFMQLSERPAAREAGGTP